MSEETMNENNDELVIEDINEEQNSLDNETVQTGTKKKGKRTRKPMAIVEPEENIETPNLQYTALQMRHDFSFQMGMPARPYIYVTIKVLAGQIIRDPAFFPHITEHPTIFEWVE